MAAPSAAQFTLVGGTRARSIPVRFASLAAFALLALFIGNLGRIPVLSTGAREAPILFNDLFVAALVGLGLISASHAKSLRLDSVAATALAFAVVGFTSAVVSAQTYSLSNVQLALSLGYLARWLLYFAVYVTLTNTLTEGDVGTVVTAFRRLVLAFAVFGVVQSIFLPNFAQMVYPDSRAYADWDIQGHRLVSTWLDPNFAGALLMIGLLLEIARLTEGVRVAWWRPTLLFAAILMTASRSSLLALFVGGVLIVLSRGVSRRLLKFGAVAAIGLAVAMPALIQFARKFNKLGLDTSAVARFVMWTRGLRIFSDHPVIGIGFNTYGYVQERYGFARLYASSYGIDGGLLFIAVMTGIVGLALYLGMIGLVWRRARRVWRDRSRDAEHRALALGAAASTAALCVHSVFTNSLLLPFLMEVVWILWALVFVLREGHRANT
jgi:O-antigen ligase